MKFLIASIFGLTLFAAGSANASRFVGGGHVGGGRVGAASFRGGWGGHYVGERGWIGPRVIGPAPYYGYGYGYAPAIYGPRVVVRPSLGIGVRRGWRR